MENSIIDGTGLYRFHNLAKHAEIDHFINNRHGGFSLGVYSSLNTAFHVGDKDEDVLRNRKKIAGALSVELLQFTLANQTHSNNIAIVEHSNRSCGSHGLKGAIDDTDALLCNTKGVFICVQMADCVPILLYDPVKQVVGAVHAGWRSTVKFIAPAAIEQLTKTFGCNPSDVVAGIGPSIGPCCYEVGHDVKLASDRAFGDKVGIIKPAANAGKYIFDQWQANYESLISSGLQRKNIELSGICTRCNSDDFFSSRASNGLAGRFLAGIMLK